MRKFLLVLLLISLSGCIEVGDWDTTATIARNTPNAVSVTFHGKELRLTSK